ncbi:MAG: phage major capsid protein [Planctomycetaceae bacterium]|nr:phage major capsid protein [Planctomycetaceae bacterium]
MSDEWVGIANSTRPKYMKGASDLTIRRRYLLARLRQLGRILFNQHGEECRWQVEYSQPPIESYPDGGLVDFSNHDAFRTLAVDWRGYVGTDTLSKKQRAMNAGDESLIDLFQTKSNRLTKAITASFSGELFKDGDAVGRTDCVHGVETFCGAGACAAGDVIAQPSDTYGLGAVSTAVGTYGGNWSTGLTTSPNATIATDWPNGQGTTEYDFLSPKLVNWSSTGWGTGATTWEANCWRAIGQAITWLTFTGGDDGMPDICVLAPNLFQGYKNHEEAIRRISIPHKAASDLGFVGNVLNQDGCAITADFDCPANTGYMLNLSLVTIMSLMPELFWMEGPDKDPRTLWSWLWGIGFFGNVQYSPKNVAKLYNYA